MALVNASVVRAAVRSLLVAPPDASVLHLCHSDGVAADILWMLLLIEVENIAALSFLLSVGSRGGDATGTLHDVVVEAPKVLNLLRVSVPHEGLVVGVEFQLLGELLLGHVHPLGMYASLVARRPQLSRQVVLDVNNLCHVFYVVRQPLRPVVVRGDLVGTAIVWDASAHLLVLRSRALQRIEVELGFVRGSADASLLLLGELLHLLLAQHLSVVFVESLGVVTD